MAEIIQFPRSPDTTDGDGGGPTEIVVRIVLEMPDELPAQPDDEPEPDRQPTRKSKGGWIWFWLGALLGLGFGG